MTQKKNKSKKKKTIFIFSFALLAITLAGGYFAYTYLYQPNTTIEDKKYQFLYIRSGWTFADVLQQLEQQKLIVNKNSFEWLCKKKGYDQHVLPGKYRILHRMNNRELVNLLMSGNQEPVRFTLNGIRTKEQLASRVGGKLETDSVALLVLLNNEHYLQNKFGMSPETILTLFIPDNYEFKWNTSAEEYLDGMAQKYKAFWNDQRKAKATEIGLSQSEVSILASIVQQEQNLYDDEKATIAGLYLNRLRLGMKLQSDPTAVYACGKFNSQRVYNKDLQIDSPYNTYRYAGLPPGPICLPLPSSIDAVLNYEKHDYIFMCAEYGTGRHNFARDDDQHVQNRKKYRQELDKHGIK